jgi:hypothetical protein
LCELATPVIIAVNALGGALGKGEPPMKPLIGWIVALVLVSSVIIWTFVAEGWWGVWGALIELLAIVVGGFVGSFLMLGAYRRFGWGESAARSIYRWSWVGGVIIVLLVLFVLGAVLEWRTGNERNPATIAFWMTFGVWIGSASRANTILKQLRTEERRP